MFLLGVLAWQLDWGKEMVSVIGSLYTGFDASLKGSIIGAVWGFADWFVGGFIIALLYNCILCCRCWGNVG